MQNSKYLIKFSYWLYSRVTALVLDDNFYNHSNFYLIYVFVGQMSSFSLKKPLGFQLDFLKMGK